ncbi:kinase-like protein [Clavulina sp. PMI_390]|nr:kinase-like protein [Clavulina sp. PMI_390]
MSAIRREIISQIQVHHQNVLPILGVASSDDHPLSIVTPFAVNGNAFEYLTKMELNRRAGAMLHIVSVPLEHLHGLMPPIIHGDLHARNIVVDDRGNGLLCDFGLSRIKHEKTRTATNIVEGGKYRYQAPELLQLQDDFCFRTTTSSDCYAFGMTILELVTLERPFAEYQNERAASNAAERGIQPKMPSPEAVGILSKQTFDMLWGLLKKMWAYEASKRPSMSRVLISIVEILGCLGGTPSPRHPNLPQQGQYGFHLHCS